MILNDLFEDQFVLLTKHYVVGADPQTVQHYRLKKDNRGYYLPQWNTSGTGFDRAYSELKRSGYQVVSKPHTPYTQVQRRAAQTQKNMNRAYGTHKGPVGYQLDMFSKDNMDDVPFENIRVKEGRMKDIDIEYQDFLRSRGRNAMTDKQFQDAYGMTRTEWAKKNRAWTQQKERLSITPDTHLFHEENQNDRNARIIAGEIEDARRASNEKLAQKKIKQLFDVGYTLDNQGRLQRLGMYEQDTARERWNKASAQREKKHNEIEARRRESAKQGRTDVPGAISRLEKLLNRPVAEGAIKNLHTELAEKYQELAPSIEKYKDSFLAGQLYDALEAIAIEHGAELELKRMMTGARNRAHMDYDTNPGGFQNWFWYLPFADELSEELMKSQYGSTKAPVKETQEIPAKMVMQSFVVEYNPATRTATISKRNQELDRFQFKGVPNLRSFQRTVSNRIENLEDDLYGDNDKASVASSSPIKISGRGYGYQDLDDKLREEQDACYHKVKSRYKVWPSAYASGALVQCRKKGVANWGNKTKK